MYVSFELQNTDTSAITEAVAIFSIRIFRKCRGGGRREMRFTPGANLGRDGPAKTTLFFGLQIVDKCDES